MFYCQFCFVHLLCHVFGHGGKRKAKQIEVWQVGKLMLNTLLYSHCNVTNVSSGICR